MNDSLSNPFSITYPTAVQTSLHSGALFARFDPLGRFVAAGRNDGTAVVWDLDTRAAVRWLEGHVKGVTSVDWSRHSRFVLTASKDWNLVVWDLASETDPPRRHATVRFDAPIASAWFHPRNSQIMLVLLASGDAYVVDLRKSQRSRVELCEPQEDEDEEAQMHRPRSAITVARFDPSGKHIFAGTSTGSVLVFNTRTKTMVGRHKIADKISAVGSIRGIEFAKSGRRMVTNSTDRTLRQFSVPTYSDQWCLECEIEPIHRFNDPITKTAWHAMSFSPDGEWLAGGAADPAAHKIYIWDIANDGQFANTLDGGREPLVYVHWHPSKPAIASTTNLGNILIWHIPVQERWGAFAGGFEEIDVNVEYEEREDEFDIEDEAEMAKRKMKEEEQEVDIAGVDGGGAQPNGVRINGEHDEDILWADEEPDEDMEGWKMKILIEDDQDGI